MCFKPQGGTRPPTFAKATVGKQGALAVDAALPPILKKYCAFGEGLASPSEKSIHLEDCVFGELPSRSDTSIHLLLPTPAVDVHQGKHCAIDLVVRSAIGANAQ